MQILPQSLGCKNNPFLKKRIAIIATWCLLGVTKFWRVFLLYWRASLQRLFFINELWKIYLYCRDFHFGFWGTPTLTWFTSDIRNSSLVDDKAISRKHRTKRKSPLLPIRKRHKWTPIHIMTMFLLLKFTQRRKPWTCTINSFRCSMSAKSVKPLTMRNPLH